ncbi:Clcn7, partial [Symbiodinium necroappetens]
VWQQYLAWVSVAVALASIAGILVCYIDPFAAGSGIPEIKCYLNGIEHFPSVVGLKTLLAKAVGIVFSVSAGLPCGKEGPMIHSGAIIGAVVAGFRIDRNIKPYVYTQEVRDLVAAGASAGVSAAFGAPLGSVLFAIEEGSSHMNPQIMLLSCIGLDVDTAFRGLRRGGPRVKDFLDRESASSGAEGQEMEMRKIFHDHVGPFSSHALTGPSGWRVPVSFGRFSNMDYHIQEFALFGLMAVCGGLLGGLFNCLNKRLTLWRQRHIGGRGHKRFLEVLLVTFVVSSFDFLVVALCSDSPLTLEDLPPTMELYWNLGAKAMKNLFHGQENYHWGFLLLFAVKNFCFACWNYGTGVPSGLFIPSLLTGAAFGRLVGQLVAVLRDLDTNGNSPFSFVAQPGTYALIGACSMLAGTARITISL